MSYVNHITYTDDGRITMVRTEETAIFESRVSRGEKVLSVDNTIDPQYYRVDVGSKTVIKKTDEELQAEGIEPPVVIDFTQFMG